MMTSFFTKHPTVTIAFTTSYLLPSLYALRDVGHGLLIDHVTSKLHNRTFINSVLFSSLTDVECVPTNSCLISIYALVFFFAFFLLL